MEIFANFALPILGVLLIIFCVASFFFAFGQRFKNTKQVIRGFGLDLEISVLTLFLLIGFNLAVSGIYLRLRGGETTKLLNEKEQLLNELRSEQDKLQGRLQEARDETRRAARITVPVNLRLPKNRAIPVSVDSKVIFRDGRTSFLKHLLKFD